LQAIVIRVSADRRPHGLKLASVETSRILGDENVTAEVKDSHLNPGGQGSALPSTKSAKSEPSIAPAPTCDRRNCEAASRPPRRIFQRRYAVN
jgi:hypothetical protein